MCFETGGGHKSWTSLCENKEDDGENHASGHGTKLQLADVPAWNNLRDEKVIHVEQGVERKGEEEEGTPPLPVRGIVVPQQEARQSCQDDDTQQVVQRCDPQQEGEQHQGRDHGDLQVVNHGPKYGRGAPIFFRSVFQPPTESSGHKVNIKHGGLRWDMKSEAFFFIFIFQVRFTYKDFAAMYWCVKGLRHHI